MNNTEKELHGYINGTERMSGMDSYDHAEGSMSYFDNDEMYYAGGDEMSYADGSPNGASIISDPYVIQYVKMVIKVVVTHVLNQ
jgi:hypothetical protein